MIVVESRRKSPATLRSRYPQATILDVTSRGETPWVRSSPFFPHSGIPVPFSPNATATSVEGIWQALKVFETADIDPTKLTISSMTGLKRTSRRLGRVLGHRAGLDGACLLPYLQARVSIYLPSYRWVLDNRLTTEIALLRELASRGDIVLLDYETNADLTDLTRPLSHAALVAAFVSGQWPVASDGAT